MHISEVSADTGKRVRKFGFDIHGVVTINAEFFRIILQALIDDGHEVHILSGPRREKIIAELAGLEIPYTHIFSITSYQESLGTDVRWDDKGNPHIADELWDKSKAEYCKQHGIDLHFDDSPKYGDYFETPYIRLFRSVPPKKV